MVYLGMTFAEVRFRNENFKDFASLIHFLLINVQTPKRSQTQKFLLFCSDELNTILSNIERTRTSFFEHRTNSNVFIYWRLNSNTSILASNEQISNLKGLTWFTKSSIEQTGPLVFRTSNGLKRVHLLVIELEHPLFGFEHSSTHH